MTKPKICNRCKKQIKEIVITKTNKTSTWCKLCYEKQKIIRDRFDARKAKSIFTNESKKKISNNNPTIVISEPKSDNPLDLLLLAINNVENTK